MSKINLTAVRIFGKKYAFDTILVIFFGALMARGIIDALRFFGVVAVFIPMIVIIGLIERCKKIAEEMLLNKHQQMKVLRNWLPD